MTISANILAPPEGLDLEEIATDTGLLRAIEREAANFKDADKEGRKLTRDQIRLISFLAGEVRRRIDSLSPAEIRELDDIRAKAHDREAERTVREIVSDVGKFIDETQKPYAEILFSRISELEIRLQGMHHTLDHHPEDYAKLLEMLSDAMTELEGLKKRGFRGFEEL